MVLISVLEFVCRHADIFLGFVISFVVIAALYTILFVKHFFSSGHSLGILQLEPVWAFGCLGILQYALIVSGIRIFDILQAAVADLTVLRLKILWRGFGFGKCLSISFRKSRAIFERTLLQG